MMVDAKKFEQLTGFELTKEGMLYDKEEERAVTCNLCAHRCYIPAGREEICKVRANHSGVLRTLVYDRLISANIDPVEKKPLFHFLPRSSAFSIATIGCNFHCRYCQNWEISQLPRIHAGTGPGERLTPEEILNLALDAGCKSIAYTYPDPTIVIDLKGFDDKRHRRVSGAKLQPVLDSIVLSKEQGGGFYVESNQLDQGRCPLCDTAFHGVWNRDSSSAVARAQIK
jgi:hypothetical protein